MSQLAFLLIGLEQESKDEFFFKLCELWPPSTVSTMDVSKSSADGTLGQVLLRGCLAGCQTLLSDKLDCLSQAIFPGSHLENIKKLWINTKVRNSTQEFP
jgi:hypothetical protein